MGSEPRPAEGQQHQHLVAGEGHAVRPEDRLDPGERDLVGPHQRGHRRHAVGGLRPAVSTHCRRASAIGSREAAGGHAGHRNASETRWTSNSRTSHIPACPPRARPPGPVRHRGEPVRRARRGDQHHAADPAGAGRRGDPPRPRPLGRRGRHARRVQEDVQGVAITSYQGGHVEYFSYLVELLRRARRRAHQGVRRRRRRHRAGGDRRAAPSAGVRDLLPGGRPAARPARDDQRDDPRLRRRPGHRRRSTCRALLAGDEAALARAITVLEAGRRRRAGRGGPRGGAAARRAGPRHHRHRRLGQVVAHRRAVRRLRSTSEDKLRIAVLAVDPTRRRGGGALLGDRIRMNTHRRPGGVFFRSLATRGGRRACPTHLADVIAACKAAGYDLVIVETPGIGQGDAAIVAVRRRLAVRDDAGVRRRHRSSRRSTCSTSPTSVAINKFERRGAEDAPPRRAPASWSATARRSATPWEEMPVFGTSAARFNDDGVTALYQHLRDVLRRARARPVRGRAARGRRPGVDRAATVVPPRAAMRYLAEIARRPSATTTPTTAAAGRAVAGGGQHLRTPRELLRRRRGRGARLLDGGRAPSSPDDVRGAARRGGPRPWRRTRRRAGRTGCGTRRSALR